MNCRIIQENVKKILEIGNQIHFGLGNSYSKLSWYLIEAGSGGGANEVPNGVANISFWTFVTGNARGKFL